MAEGQPPYYHIPPTRAMFVISNKPPTGLSDTKAFSKDFVDFLAEVLTVDTSARPSAQDLLRSNFLHRSPSEPPPAAALGATLGPRLAVAPPPASPGQPQPRGPSTPSAARQNSLHQRRPSGSLLLPAPPCLPPLDTQTPTLDAYATMTPAPDPSQFRRWQAQSPAGSLLAPSATAGAGEAEEADDAEADRVELVRRAREWVNRTVPMQTVEDDLDSPPPEKADKASFDVWDSDEEGVETRTRAEAQPEAGAGGPSGATPYFMQVLGKQWGADAAGPQPARRR
uniref:Protein kinase domain-containing protein n=1 Tax=Pyrodinium bahamense TaxID=73915 RepID=A0A7R9ZV44_9DINO|mmetsp:Transcript_1099/g.2981  ORF Transcript_1099/g.2981 Transcript_1099/m.2981 type:complete len:283 (+) Transcript_1099:2-850(+)